MNQTLLQNPTTDQYDEGPRPSVTAKEEHLGQIGHVPRTVNGTGHTMSRSPAPEPAPRKQLLNFGFGNRIKTTTILKKIAPRGPGRARADDERMLEDEMRC